MTHLADLTPYHRNKIMERAYEWRSKNHPAILASMKGVFKESEPEGSVIFDPKKWTAENWIWFSAHYLTKNLAQRIS